MKEHGRGLIGDGEGFAFGECVEGGASETEGPDVIGMRGGQVVAGENGLFHEASPLLTPPHRVLVVQLRRRTTHIFLSILSLYSNEEANYRFEWWQCLMQKKEIESGRVSEQVRKGRRRGVRRVGVIVELWFTVDAFTLPPFLSLFNF